MREGHEQLRVEMRGLHQEARSHLRLEMQALQHEALSQSRMLHEETRAQLKLLGERSRRPRRKPDE